MSASAFPRTMHATHKITFSNVTLTKQENQHYFHRQRKKATQKPRALSKRTKEKILTEEPSFHLKPSLASGLA